MTEMDSAVQISAAIGPDVAQFSAHRWVGWLARARRVDRLGQWIFGGEQVLAGGTSTVGRGFVGGGTTCWLAASVVPSDSRARLTFLSAQYIHSW
jgi:hypothetical protein